MTTVSAVPLGDADLAATLPGLRPPVAVPPPAGTDPSPLGAGEREERR